MIKLRKDLGSERPFPYCSVCNAYSAREHSNFVELAWCNTCRSPLCRLCGGLLTLTDNESGDNIVLCSTCGYEKVFSELTPTDELKQRSV